MAKSGKKEKKTLNKEVLSYCNFSGIDKSAKIVNLTKLSERVSASNTKDNNRISQMATKVFNDVCEKKKYGKNCESTPASKFNSVRQSPKENCRDFDPIEEVVQQKSELEGIVKCIKSKFTQNSVPFTTTADMYKIGKLLGKGAFGKVHLGVHKLTGKLVAIKSIKKEFLNDQHSKKKVMQEFSILMQLNHESIITLYETFESTKHILFVIELCSGGDLLNYVRKRRKLKENYAKYIFKQVIEGLAYCHQHNILHRDIKPDNILINGRGRIKICDFGVSKAVIQEERMHEQCGTPAYIAPEILKGEGYDGFTSDIWSAGVMLYAMLYGTVPFKGNSMHDLHSLIMKGKYHLKEDVSTEARDLVTAMLTIIPEDRITISGILTHSWMQKIEAHLEMFTEGEKQSIMREYDYKNRNKDESEREFTEQNIDSTMNDLTHNASTKSIILAPFNSTVDKMESSNAVNAIPKKNCIKFKGKVKDIDRQYEKNNNYELDNGVCNKFLRSESSSGSSLGDSFKCESVPKENSKLFSSIIHNDNDAVSPVGGQNIVTSLENIGKSLI
jgi:serine/threonine protein kinase